MATNASVRFDHPVSWRVGAEMPAMQSAQSSRVAVLRGLALFAELGEVELHRLADYSHVRLFERGTVVVQPARCEDCVILLRGRVKAGVRRSSACGEVAVGLFEPGDLVSEGGWGASTPTPVCETVALEESEALFLPRKSLEACMERNPKVAIRFLDALASKLRRALDLAAQTACLDVSDRLYRRLLELSETRGVRTQRGLRIEHGLHQRELAASIGASREVVNKRLAEWRKQALVATGRGYVTVRNPVGLALAVSSAVRDARFASSVGEKAAAN